MKRQLDEDPVPTNTSYSSGDAGEEEEARMDGDNTIYEAFNEEAEEECTFDRDSYMDSWLMGITEDDMKKAAAARKKTEVQTRDDSIGLEDAVQSLVSLFKDDHATVADLLRTEIGQMERITTCATVLLENGIYEIYELTRADLMEIFYQ